MKIERISENKIKVMLTLDDLHDRDIDLSALSYNSPQAQKLFMDMMHIAETEYGFLIGDSQIFIEAIPTPPEGFEIIVSKVEDDKDFESIHKYIKSKLKKSDLSTRKKGKKISTNILIYKFLSFEDLCNVVQELSWYIGDGGSLYKLENDYYLVIPKNFKEIEGSELLQFALSEFGEKMDSPNLFESYLEEYGQRLIEDNALFVIKNYFIK